MADLEITQIRSLIGSRQDQRATVRSLGLRRVNHTVTQPDRPEIRGMVAKVSHLVEVRYRGEDQALPLQPGQTPHGVGNPPAAPSVADEDAAQLLAEAQDAVAVSGAVDDVADLTQHAPGLTSTDAPDAPRAPGAPASEEDVVDPQKGPQGEQ